jgi:FMN-dependent NADH-azoreductase
VLPRCQFCHVVHRRSRLNFISGEPVHEAILPGLQVPWLRNMLGFLGMTDVEVIRVEGTAFGPERLIVGTSIH